ncbi:MAG: hypothetical protein NC548_49970 [Lachnospiraceae bacterium]|nr:hypothetical protein [Lachnospiraceae bacterium]
MGLSMRQRQIAFEINKQGVFESGTAQCVGRIPKEYRDDGVVALIRVKDCLGRFTDIGIYGDDDWLFLECHIAERGRRGAVEEGLVPTVNDIIKGFER